MDIEKEKEKYRNNNNMDYLKAVKLLDFYKGDNEVFKTIYEITRLFIPPVMYKYYSLTDDKLLNNAKLETLRNKSL